MTRTSSVRTVLVAAAAVAAAACGTVPGTPAVPAQVEGPSFVVRGVRLFDGLEVTERTSVVVRDGRIASIGDHVPRDLPVVDGSGKTLLPGFIDAHGHVPNGAALRDALRFGVTTVLDMLSPIDSVRPLKDQRDRLERTDRADLYTAGSPLTSPGGLGTNFGIPFRTIREPGEARDLVGARLAEGSDYIKILYEPGAPLFTTVSRATLQAIVAAAHERNALAVAHVSALAGARDAVEVGVDGLVHVFGDSLADEAFLRAIGARGTFVVPTLSIFGAFQRTGLGPSLVEDPRISPFLTAAQRSELLRVGPDSAHPMAPYLRRFDVARAQENVRRLRRAGVRILAGTDAPNLGSHGVTLHGELQLLVEAGLTPGDALAAATSGPAQAFRLGDRGRIVPGARADLILVDGNPLQDIRHTRAIARIYKNGFEVTRALPSTSTGAAP